MKIALVLLNEFLSKSRNKRFSFNGRKGAYAPTTLSTLAALVPHELNAEINIIDEFIESFDPNTIQADLVGLSFTTPNAWHAYKLAAILKKRGITVVFGGFHTTALPTEATMHADACVIGYAEKSWPKLLHDFKKGELQKMYNEPYEQAFTELPTGRLDLIKKKKYFYPYTLEYSRSCNNSCKFCVIPSFSNGGLVCRPILNVCRDIRAVGGKNIVFLDRQPNRKYRRIYSIMPGS
ncbi:MAG: cobalamin-dependent protein [Marinilabiliales bacterium]|nr:cobalamin-dependent protein [Marinilabiliales bacterium]